MSYEDFTDAMTRLDSDLLDEYFTRRDENLRRLAKRRVMRKRTLTAAACFLLILAIGLQVDFHFRYPYIPLENAVGDVSVRYVPGWMVEGSHDGCFIDYTDTSLFNQVEYVFFGTIEKIEHIRFDFDKAMIFRSILTIKVDECYKGSVPPIIKIFTLPITQKGIQSPTLLQLLSEGDCGFFMAKQITDNKIMHLNKNAIVLSDLADAMLIDSYSFAFIKEKDTDQYYCYDTLDNYHGKFFSSLEKYDRKSILDYINEMIK